MKNFILLLFLTLIAPHSYCQWYHTPGPDGCEAFNIIAHNNNVIAWSWTGGLYWSDDYCASWHTSVIPKGNWLSYGYLGYSNGVFYAGINAGILISTDGGASWVESDSGMQYNGNQTFTSYGKDVLIGTNKGVYISTDNGNKWKPINNGINNIGVSTLLVKDSVIYAGTFNGNGLWKSEDYGNMWARSDSGLPKYSTFNYTYIASIGNYLYCGKDTLFRSIDGGVSWQKVNPVIYFNGIQTRGNKMYGFQVGVGVFISSDSGKTWVKNSTQLSGKSAQSMTLTDKSVVVGTRSGVFVSTDDGANWTKSNHGLAASFVQGLAFKGNSLFASTNDGIYLSNDMGYTWLERDSGMTNNLNVFAIAASDKYIYAGAGHLYRSGDDGVSWQTSDSGIDVLYTSILVNEDTVFTRNTTHVYRSIDAGKSWVVADTGIPSASLHNGRAFLKLGNRIFIGVTNGVYYSDNNGKSWQKAGTGFNGSEYILCFTVCDTNIFAGTTSAMYVSSLNNFSWKQVHYYLNYEVYDMKTWGDTIWAGTRIGFFVSGDKGSTWKMVNDPLLPYIAVNDLAVKDGHFFAGTYGAGVWTTNPIIYTGENKIQEKENILIYPNPATDVITIDVSCINDNCYDKVNKVSIYDMQGRILKCMNLTLPKTEVNVGELSQGIYLMQFRTKSSETSVAKFVKTN